MLKETVYYRDLLLGFIENRITSQELEELFQYAEQLPESFSQLMGDPGIKGSLESKAMHPEWIVPEEISRRMRERLMSAMDDKVTVPSKIHFFRKSWFRYAASILALVGIAAVATLVIRSKKESVLAKNEKPVIVKDIAPGGNKAVLYLANGRQVVLDSVHSGQIAQLGSISVTKTEDGKLVYALSDKKPGDENGMNELKTPRGGIYQLTLPDGTTAWLNAASSIIYPTHFKEGKREVKISGEVYFEVAHDPSHPFLVSLPAKTKEGGEGGHWMQVEVLGTHFNINNYEDDPESLSRTTLLEGSVRISAHGIRQTITPGEQAATSFSGNNISIARGVNLEKVMAWKNGEMVLTHGDVRKLMHDISRWYDVDIEYRSVVPEGKFSGSIDRNVPLSSILNVLRAYGIDTRLEGKKIIVL